MGDARAATTLCSVADVGTSGLEIGAVRARTDLKPLLATGRPDFYVIGLGRCETHVAGTKSQDPVSETKFTSDVFGVVYKLFQFPI